VAVSSRVGWAIASLAFGIVLVCLAFSGMRHGQTTGSDPEVLVRGVRVAFDCIGDGRFTHCGLIYPTPDAAGKLVGPFPLLQYLPAAVIVGLGASANTATRALAWLNLFAFAGMFGLILMAGRRLPSPRTWTPLLLAIAASGPLYYFATAAFGEMLAATALLGAVVAALYRRPWLLGVTTMIASLGKETIPPFVLVLVIVAARERTDGLLPRKRLTVAAIVGTMSAAVLSTLFNVFRFGTLGNRYYLEPALRTVPSVRGTFFAAVFAAPNGGIAWFWTAALLLFVVGAAWALRRAVGGWRDVAAWGPALAIVALIVVWGAMLASWFSPFGWTSWGPRLFIPVIPAATVALAYAGGPAFADVVRRGFARPLATALLVGLTLVCTWPQSAAPWTWQAVVPVILTPDPDCPTLPSPWIEPEVYQRCEALIAWRLRPSIIGRSLRQQNVPSGVTSVAAVAGIVALAGLARRRPHRGAGDHHEVRQPVFEA
jgi:hypothetical protein